MNRALVAIALLLAPAAPAAAAPCPPPAALGEDAARLGGEGATVAYRLVPAAIAVGQPFAVEAIACIHGAAPTRIRVDAGMPQHGHGMNYAPSERGIAPGHAVFDGLVFHMPGRWTVIFDLYDGARRTRLADDIRVPP